MKKTFSITVLLTVFVTGCNTDVVTSRYLTAIGHKCVYIKTIESKDPYISRVLRDVFEKEFIRKQVMLCDAETANVILTGSTILKTRYTENKNWFGGRESSQAIESVTITAKDKLGNILLSASYNNVNQLSPNKLAKDFGSTLANKLR